MDEKLIKNVERCIEIQKLFPFYNLFKKYF